MDTRLTRTSFGSDNYAGASPEVVAALAACNAGQAAPYGNDDISARVSARLAEVFGHPVAAFLVPTGTAANALALSLGTPPWGAVLCHKDSHINTDECGAPEFFTQGAKLIALDGENAKLTPEAVAAAAALKTGDVHTVQPAWVSITQATELGGVYTPEEVAALGAVCRAHGLRLHMDGARFAGALAALRCTPAEITWKAGVDALSFGTVKNGTMNADAVVAFAPDLAAEAGFRRKRSGHLTSKMRFVAAQIEAYLENDLWLANARHANAMAARLADGLSRVAGVEILAPAVTNILFCRFPLPLVAALLEQGFGFYHDRWGPGVVRLVTSFATTADDVDTFVEAASRAG